MLLNLLPKLIMNQIRPPGLDIRVKDHVNLLQSPARSLGVHEKHMEGHHAAEHPEDDVGPPLDVVERGRDEVCQGEVEDPVGRGGESDALGSVF